MHYVSTIWKSVDSKNTFVPFNKWMDEFINGLMDEFIHGWMYGFINEWMA